MLEFGRFKAMYTPQEALIGGGSPETNINMDSLDEGAWHIPQGRLSGSHSLAEIIALRERTGYHTNRLMVLGLGIKVGPEEIVGFALSEIDPQTEQTKEDPKVVVGRWNPESRRLEGVDITAKMIQVFAEDGIDLHMRGRPPHR
jgi:hypothetical protein